MRIEKGLKRCQEPNRAIGFLTPFLPFSSPYSVARYVERNALRAKLVRRAEQWHWGSLHRWLRGSAEDRQLLAPWPLPRKSGWTEFVNTPQTEAELAAVRKSVDRGNPFGDESWSDRAVRRLGLETTLRPRGRPRRQSESLKKS